MSIEKELIKAKKALEKREKILSNWTIEKERLIKIIDDENTYIIDKIHKQRELEYVLKKVGGYSARVDFYKWKVEYLK
ncbi:MAG: hypothetical protein K0S93_63 [Nitrososphaeraceae archaeon]|jgi:hypothetical protein|nr:hypothetical protein [Nitrososphaeraceae archaeon]